MGNQKRQWDLGDWIVAGSAGLIGLHILGSVAFPKAKAILGTVESAVSTALEIGAASAAIGGPLYAGYRIMAARKAQTEVEVIRILPRVNNKFDPSAVRQLINQLAGLRQSRLHQLIRGREWMRFVVCREAEGIGIYIVTPKDRARAVVAAWASVYPDSELFEVESLPQLYGYRTYAIPLMKGPLAGLPFRDIGDVNKEAPSPLIAAMAHMRTEGSWVEVSFSPGSWRKLQKQAKQAAQATGSGPWTDDPDIKARRKATYSRFTGREIPLNLVITLGSPDLGELQSMANGFSAAFSADNRVGFRAPWPLEDSIPFPAPGRQFLLTSEEAGCLIHLPPEHPAAADVIRLEEGERSLDPDELAEGISIGYLRHPIQERRPVSIPLEQFTKHFFLGGMIGSGKSSFLVMMAQSMIDAWLKDDNAPGFTFIDPARETAAIILSRLLKAEAEGKKVPWHKVHYFYLGPTEYPIGLNLLHKDGRPPDVIAKEAAALIRFAYSSQAPKMERILENALLTLMEDERPHTLMGVVPLLLDEEFRRRIIPRLTDPVTKEFWEKEWAQEKNPVNSLDSLLNRLSPLRSNPTMRRMFGQTRSALDIRKWMDQGHIVLIDTLNVAPEDVRLALGYIINRYHTTAKQRSSGSKLHMLMIDEAHLIQVPILSKIIAEDRKFGLSLGLITQYLGQFDQWLVDSITENMGTIISCRQGEQSAARITKITNGAFQPEMLQSLPERVAAIYTSTKQEGRSTITTCLAEADPPTIYLPDGKPAEYRNRFQMQRALEAALKKGQELQRRDGREASLVDREVEEYLRPKTVLQDKVVRLNTGNSDIDPNELW
jgi:hypothetical protein